MTQRQIRRLASALAGIAALVGFAQGARAQVVTWNGGGAASTWTTAANWAGGGAPASSSTSSIAFGGKKTLSPDMNQNWSAGSIAFSKGASAFTLGSTGGYTLTIYGGRHQQQLQCADDRERAGPWRQPDMERHVS